MKGTSNAPKIVHSNKNLLDNWDFTNPVNQRGQSSYSSVGCGIDRWRNGYNGAAMQIVNGGVKVANNGVKYTGMLQIVPIKNLKAGDSYTLSGLFKSITNGWYIELYLYDNNEAVASATSADKNYNGSDIFVSSTLIVPDRTFGKNLQMHVHIYNQATNQNSCVISAAKLEKGEVSTLKNDALGVSYVEELIKCKRYLWRINALDNAARLFGTCAGHNTSLATSSILLPDNFRTTDSAPIIEYSNLSHFKLIKGSEEKAVTGIVSSGAVDSSVAVNISSSGIIAGDAYAFTMQKGSWIQFNKEL